MAKAYVSDVPRRLAVMILLAAGCGAEPIGVAPEAGYSKEVISYSSPAGNPFATVHTLSNVIEVHGDRAQTPGEVNLRVKGVRAAIAIQGELEFEGGAVESAPVTVSILGRSKKRRGVVMGSGVGIATRDQEGRLTFRVDLLCPHEKGEFDVTVNTLSLAAGDSDDVGPVTIAGGRLRVE